MIGRKKKIIAKQTKTNKNIFLIKSKIELILSFLTTFSLVIFAPQKPQKEEFWLISF